MWTRRHSRYGSAKGYLQLVSQMLPLGGGVGRTECKGPGYVNVIYRSKAKAVSAWAGETTYRSWSHSAGIYRGLEGLPLGPNLACRRVSC